MRWWLHNGCGSSTSPPTSSPSSPSLHVFQIGAVVGGRSKSCPATINSKAKNSECSGEEVAGDRMGEVGSYPNLITRNIASNQIKFCDLLSVVSKYVANLKPNLKTKQNK